MALLSFKNFLSTSKYCVNKIGIRSLVSKQLVYTQFGDPLKVVKIRECTVPPLGSQDVLVRMLAAPINPADINTIQGRNLILPKLPTVPGDEGVGEIVEIGEKVVRYPVGARVVLATRGLGSWRFHGVFHERALHRISKKLPLPEASMLTISPCAAYRMIKDFRRMHHGETVVQNAANSPIGQCVIQLCKTWGMKTLNIVANHYGYEYMKKYLLHIGGTTVCTLEEAEELTSFNTSLSRPVLALNCLGGKYEDVMLKLLDKCGSIVYYGCAYDVPHAKKCLRPDVKFYKFHYGDWCAKSNPIAKCTMLNRITELMVVGKVKAPMFQPVELKDYVHAFQNTVHCEAFATENYVFDFSLPC